MPASLDPQLAMDERAINNPDLEAELERHLRAKDDVAEARGVVKVARKAIDKHLATIDSFEPGTALRVGRFRITKKLVEGRHVEFDSEDREQISFGLVDADGNATRRSSGGGRPKGGKPVKGDDDTDLRPTGEVNADSLRGTADRSVLPEPTPLRPN